MAYVAGPFDREHVYLSWGGKLPGDEQWSCGIRLKHTLSGVIDNAQVITLGPSWVIALTAFHASSLARIAPAAKLSFVKANIIATDGSYREPTTNQWVQPDVAGGWGGATYPNQCTVVASLETGFSRGPAHAGRIYLPLPSATVAADGRMSDTEADGIRGATQGMITAVNGVSGDFQAAVFSRKAGAPTNRLITTVRVGRVIDTQRRRRRSLLESYT